eukprot:CAMPEP_0178437330 /NCGR_PEP_ID=MMETSP0689_2-20121128/34930_1 /TAXON_ID=160604 /ORGANISM="Amphidinium massartii, Strain CS-259" /LENGTH=192 /DNA_ID=CAMNT_0020059515 /DNA_START=32 /DNA_END=611 /DNA_ORIENTATION=-
MAVEVARLFAFLSSSYVKPMPHGFQDSSAVARAPSHADVRDCCISSLLVYAPPARPPPMRPVAPPTVVPIARPAPEPIMAPTGIDRPKVNTAGTTPHMAPTAPPTVKPTVPPPAPRAIAPPAADTCTVRSETNSKTPSLATPRCDLLPSAAVALVSPAVSSLLELALVLVAAVDSELTSAWDSDWDWVFSIT